MIKVALVGIGNCASALVQGVSYYRQNPGAPGLIFQDVCGFFPADIEFVAAFDVARSKVGKKLDEAIFCGTNNTINITNTIDFASCLVMPAPVFDGIGKSYRGKIDIVEGTDHAIDGVLSTVKPDMLVNYLPVGSEQASRFWAEKCLEHHIAFVNAIPSFIVSDSEWAMRFADAGIPCAGDDVKSQIGATIIHRALAHIFFNRGGQVDSTYQLNFGGNMDFYNMLEDSRLQSKKKSKVFSVKSEMPETPEGQLHISPTDYIQFLGDRKIAYINITGYGFASTPIEVECKMKVWDSPNSAGVVIDVIRFMAASIVKGIVGPISVCPFYFKSPPFNLTDDESDKIARSFASERIK